MGAGVDVDPLGQQRDAVGSTVATAAVVAAEDVSSTRTSTMSQPNRPDRAGLRPDRRILPNRAAGRPVAAVRAQRDHPVLGLGRPLDRHQQPLAGQLLDQALAPFDHGHGVGSLDVKIKIIHFGDRAEPVGVDVDERQPTRPMHPGDDEGRRDDPFG